MLKSTLDTIDGAIKKLVTPTAMIVATAIMSKGLNQPQSNDLLIKGVMWLLVLWAIGFMIASGFQALKEFEASGINLFLRFVLSTSFFLVYLVLFIVAIFLALGKISV